MLVRDWMSTNLKTVRCGDELAVAREMLAKERIRQLPVLRRGRLDGIVTDRDLRSAPAPARCVEDVMAHRLHTVTSDDSVDSAAHLLRTWKINAVPVVDGGKLCGILTTTDILDAFVAFSGVAEPSYRLAIEPKRGSRTNSLRKIIEDHRGKVCWLRSSGSGKERRVHTRVIADDVDAVVQGLEAVGHVVDCVVASARSEPQAPASSD